MQRQNKTWFTKVLLITEEECGEETRSSGVLTTSETKGKGCYFAEVLKVHKMHVPIETVFNYS